MGTMKNKRIKRGAKFFWNSARALGKPYLKKQKQKTKKTKKLGLAYKTLPFFSSHFFAFLSVILAYARPPFRLSESAGTQEQHSEADRILRGR